MKRKQYNREFKLEAVRRLKLRGQSVASLALTLLQHAPEFNTSQGRLCGPERFESEHGSDYALDEPVILLHHVIQILALANLDTFIFISVELFDACCIGSTFVDINQAGFAVRSDRFIQKS